MYSRCKIACQRDLGLATSCIGFVVLSYREMGKTVYNQADQLTCLYFTGQGGILPTWD